MASESKGRQTDSQTDSQTAHMHTRNVGHDSESGICQSISGMPPRRRDALHREKCLQPKKPRCADSPDGCALSRTACRLLSMLLLRICMLRTGHAVDTPPCRYGRHTVCTGIQRTRFLADSTVADARHTCACLPQRRKTTPSRLRLMCSMTASVNVSQPILECEFALFACTQPLVGGTYRAQQGHASRRGAGRKRGHRTCTVSAVFSSSTP